MVQHILDSHPAIFGGPEFDRIGDIISLRNKLHQSITSARIDVFCSYDDVDRAICLLIENLLLPSANKYGCKMISEKTPWNVLVFNELLEVCPEAKFLRVVRDPRAVVASMLDVGKRFKKKRMAVPHFTENTAGAIRCIQKCLAAGFLAEKAFPNRIYTVTYELLVKNPESMTRKICEFLEIEWEQEMIWPGNKKHVCEKNVDGIWCDMEMYNRNPVVSEIDKWQHKLSNIQKSQVYAAFRASGDLKRLGYIFDDDKPSKIYRTIGITTVAFSSTLREVFCKLIKLMRKSHILHRFYRLFLEGLNVDR